MNPRSRPLVASLALTALGALLPASASAQSGNPEDIARAKILFEQAVEAMKQKDYAAACPKLEDVVRLVPDGIGARIELGGCYEGAGRLASAWATYTKAEGVASQAGQEARRKEAEEHAAKVRPRLATLTIVVPDAVRALAGLAVTSDGAAIGQPEWGVAVPVDKGRHVVAATATGRKRWEKAVEVAADGGATTVAIEPPAAEEETSAPAPLAPQDLSHRWQPGAMARLDIDPLNPGVRTAVGLTIGLFDYLELGASALIGKTMGVEPQLTGYVLKGAWKPLLNIGAPIFFSGGARAGVRGAGGVAWDVNRHFGIFAQVGGGYFPNAQPGYSKAVFLPALGVQGRI